MDEYARGIIPEIASRAPGVVPADVTPLDEAGVTLADGCIVAAAGPGLVGSLTVVSPPGPWPRPWASLPVNRQGITPGHDKLAEGPPPEHFHRTGGLRRHSNILRSIS